MLIRVNRSSIEICVLVGCLLVVFFTAMQIITLASKSVTSYDTNVIASEGTARQISVKQEHKTEHPGKRNRAALAQARLRLRSKTQLELRAVERSLASLLKEKAPTPEQTSRKIENDIYGRRILDIIQKAEHGDTAPVHVNSSRVRQLGSISWRNSRNYDRSNEAHSASVPYVSKTYGLPLSFEHTADVQEVANAGEWTIKKSVHLKHFKNIDESQESELKNIVREAENFREQNFTRLYEDNFLKVKKQFQEGSELFVDEDLLRKYNSNNLDVCPIVPESLVGNTTDIVLNITLDIEDIIYNNSDISDGGEWKPTACISRHRVAIIIPYRDRWTHLKLLLFYLIPTLKRQQIHFRIFVVEQHGNETFNKGRIMNAAFKEAIKLFDFHCVAFHDVDLVPEDDRNMYSCTEQPKHMSHSIDKFQYILPYQGLVGGVLIFRREHFQLVNGYSNMYWGWGAEDDDMTTRILYNGLRIYRPPITIGKYKMVKHEGRKTSEVVVRMKLLRSAAKRSKLEGLNNVKYKLLFTHIERLFTHFIVDIGPP